MRSATIATSLERMDQRKSLLYFSRRPDAAGDRKPGEHARRDERSGEGEYGDLQRGRARPAGAFAGGNASTGSLRGTAAYSGAAMQSNLNSNFASQETLARSPATRVGKAFFDSNDFAPAFQQIQHDTEAYYIVGFHSTNTAKDGSYRHLTVKLNRSDVKLDYRPGYFAPADFQHQKTEDRELQALTEQMRSDLPATDVAIYLQALYFRLEDNKFFVPVSLIVPGSQIPLSRTAIGIRRTSTSSGR
jgi:hypothetical protein